MSRSVVAPGVIGSSASEVDEDDEDSCDALRWCVDRNGIDDVRGEISMTERVPDMLA